MTPLQNISPASSDRSKKTDKTLKTTKLSESKHKKRNTNWHEAAACAVQIELRDYAHLLQFQTEYCLGKNHFRIDLLIIKKLCENTIPKNIAQIFNTFNLFEIKGMSASVNTDAYYKTIGYAGLLIDQTGKTNQYINTDISLSFLCLHYPKVLMKHLTEKRKLMVANFSPGVYHISNEIFPVQIIVTSRLSPEENLYLNCLTDKLQNTALFDRLAADYKVHQEQEIYRNYMHQLSNANAKSKGENTMAVCEGILNLYGTSTEEIEARTRNIYLPKIEALTAENQQQASQIHELSASNNELSASNNELSASNNELSSQIDYLKSLLSKHNIPFSLKP